MKMLEKTFQASNDGNEIHTYTQLKRTDKVAMYKRERVSGKVYGYEVFEIKTIKKGAKLPNGKVEEEDREAYPGGKSFGKKNSYFCNSEHRAEVRYEEVVESIDSRQQNNDEDNEDFQFPDGNFTINDLCELNPSYGKPNIYADIQKMIKDGLVKKVGEMSNSSGRGKKMIVYTVV